MENLILSAYSSEAYNAYRNTSFSPEVRAKQIIEECSAELISDLEKLPVEFHEEYKEKYISKFRNWMSAKSRCASTMITGGSNFNVRRNEKANRSEHNRLTEFIDFKKNFFARVKKAEERAKSPEEKRAELFNQYKKEILSSATSIIEIDKGINTYSSRPLLVANFFGRIQTIIKKGDYTLSKMVFDLLKEIHASDQIVKPIFTNRHKIWKLFEEMQEKIVDSGILENEVFPFDGGQVVINYKEDRLQITHDSIPSKEIRTKLKSYGFKWSPYNVAWQRRISEASKHYAIEITGVEFTTK